MSEIGFEPITGQLGIPGTSYSIQVGKINGKWAIRLMKGKEVIDGDLYNAQTMKQAATKFCTESMDAGAPWTDKQFDEISATFKEKKGNGAVMENKVEHSTIYFYILE